ncbi:hypothetical protein TNCV_4371371 [Trichonephila clavipes]|nr:hypothetical protein TNCV_4371371 [Trichonephila clavipes]
MTSPISICVLTTSKMCLESSSSVWESLLDYHTLHMPRNRTLWHEVVPPLIARCVLVLIASTLTAQQHIDDILRTITFQHDNVQPLTARVAMKSLQVCYILPWQSRSPHLPPLETILNVSGRQL